MQWDIDGLLVWLITISIYTITLEEAMWKPDALSRINWGKDDQTLPAESIQAIVTSAITGQGKHYIDTITWCPQAIESFALPVPKNIQVCCKSMTTSEIDRYHCSDQFWNPNCMTLSDLLKV